VEVRDGVDENGQLVGKYCGKIAPSPVVSSGNQLYIKFVSDYETHGAGFSIRYEVFKTGEMRNSEWQTITKYHHKNTHKFTHSS
jgi:hypothetical protein